MQALQGVRMYSLSTISFRQMVLSSRNPAECVLMALNDGMIRRRVLCVSCRQTAFVLQNAPPSLFTLDRFCWRCPGCKRRTSIRHDSYFENHKLSLGTILLFMYLFCEFPKLLGQYISRMVEISPKAVSQWGVYVRESVSHYFLSNPTRLGGNGSIVQIDESLYGAKSKYHRGRDLSVNQVWVFGLSDSTTSRCVMWMVQNRDRATLTNLIRAHVVQGSMIHSDQWAAYGGQTLTRLGYRHQSVNHSENYVDPQPGAHTQQIESLWGKCKAELKVKSGTVKNHLPGYLDWFCFRREAKPLDLRAVSLFVQRCTQVGYIL